MNKAAHGWNEYCPNLNEVSVEGDHYSILLGDAAHFIADCINYKISQQLDGDNNANNRVKSEDTVDAWPSH